jgi:CheY-like chemotaxis protein
MKAGRILVIDDDPTIQYVAGRVLAEADYSVAAASDGNEGLSLYQQQASDVVVVDLIMAGMEGIETIRRLRKLDPDVRILAISGGGRSGTPDFLRFAAQFGALDTLAKPFLPAELVGKVDALMPAKVPERAPVGMRYREAAR